MINLKRLQREPTSTLAARIPVSLKDWVKLFCKNNGIFESALVTELIQDFKRRVDQDSKPK